MPQRALLNGESFYAWHLKPSHRDRRFQFKCPHCADNFILVMGEVREHHFRHVNGRDHGTENESPSHLAMKEYLGRECEKNGLDFIIEKRFDREGNIHIVDFILNFNKKEKLKWNLHGLAIECQCSSIGVSEVEERNRLYFSEGFFPVWILGEKYFDNASNRVGDDGQQRITHIEKHLYDDHGFLYFISDYKFYLSSFQFKTSYKGLYSLKEMQIQDFLDRIYMKIRKYQFQKNNRDDFPQVNYPQTQQVSSGYQSIRPSGYNSERDSTSKDISNVSEIDRVYSAIDSIIDKSNLEDADPDEFIKSLIIHYISSYNAISKNEILILLKRYERDADYKSIMEDLHIQKKLINYCSDGRWRFARAKF
jgi:competence CoiA-like predicted nuclease